MRHLAFRWSIGFSIRCSESCHGRIRAVYWPKVPSHASGTGRVRQECTTGSCRAGAAAPERRFNETNDRSWIRGGIAPPGRIRAVVLKMAEREEISRGLGSGESVRSIARRLARAPSTVSREAARHGGRTRYRANHADYEAARSALRPKPCRLALNGRLRNAVASKLALEWSPEQVSGWLKIRYPDDESMRSARLVGNSH